MWTVSEIESYVASQPSVVRETFYTLIEADSTSAVDFYKNGFADGVKQLLIKSGVEVSPTPLWMQSIMSQYSIEEFMAVLTAASEKEVKSPLFKLKRFFFGGLTEMAVKYLSGVDLKNATPEQRGQIGDGMTLACFYLNCK